METKKEIRKQILADRDALSPDVWQTDTDAITARVVAHPWFIGAELLFCYIDCRNEAGTRAILQEAWRLGKTVAVPKVESAGRMQFYEIHDFNGLTAGAYGVPEPTAAGTNRIIPKKTQQSLMILPGVAFDLQGGRIGYGGGFYDRFLGRYPFLRKIALGYEMQIVEQIPTDAADIKLDWLLTEKRSISYANKIA